MTDLPDPIDAERLALADEAYKRFPDQTESSEHPLGKIVVDNGSLRYAFLEGARFATSRAPRRDEPVLKLCSYCKSWNDGPCGSGCVWSSNDPTFDALAHPAASQGEAAHRARMDALEEAAVIAQNGCLVPPDGGSPTEAEREMCDGIASAIRLRKLKGAETVFAAPAPSRPAAQPGEMREDIIRQCAAIADKYNDCGGSFIAEKIRDLAFESAPASANEVKHD